ncbi:MAG: hypothetical protein ABIP74_04905 [Candidatus Saccharimonas sp.]
MRERRNLAAVIPMASRAVAICEGCPMAKFCATKTVAPCESTEVRAQQIEDSGGEYITGNHDKPIELSYRKQLMDDKIPLVLANLHKKKEQPLLPTRPSSIPPISKRVVPQSRARPMIATPTSKPKAPEATQGKSADLLADILVSMMGISSLSTVRDKKRV